MRFFYSSFIVFFISPVERGEEAAKLKASCGGLPRKPAVSVRRGRRQGAAQGAGEPGKCRNRPRAGCRSRSVDEGLREISYAAIRGSPGLRTLTRLFMSFAATKVRLRAAPWRGDAPNSETARHWRDWRVLPSFARYRWRCLARPRQSPKFQRVSDFFAGGKLAEPASQGFWLVHLEFPSVP